MLTVGILFHGHFLLQEMATSWGDACEIRDQLRADMPGVWVVVRLWWPGVVGES